MSSAAGFRCCFRRDPAGATGGGIPAAARLPERPSAPPFSMTLMAQGPRSTTCVVWGGLWQVIRGGLPDAWRRYLNP